MTIVTQSTLFRALGITVPLLASTVALRAQSATPPPADAATTTTTTTTATTTSTATPSEDTVNLPTFNVSETRADPYLPADALSVSRIAGSIIDSPFTVNVVTREVMDNLGASASYDVDRYLAGMSNGRGAGIGGISDRQDVRGFESLGKTIDNFGTSFQANWDPAFIERTELVMGPDTILSPTGTPGGTVSILTKSPLFTQGTDLTTELGNYSANKWTLDSTGPLTKKLAYRAIVSYQDADTYTPGAVRQQNLALMLTYNFSATTKLTFKYFGEDWEERGEMTNVNDNGEMIYTPDTVGGEIISNSTQPGFAYRGWNGAATWSRRNDRVNIPELQFTTVLFDRVSMRFAAEILADHFLQDAAYPSVSPSDSAWNAQGQVTAVSVPSNWSVTSMPVVGQFSDIYGRTLSLQNDYAANFHPGPVSIQEVSGWTYSQAHTLYSYSAQDKNPVDLPNVDLLLNDGQETVGAGNHPPMADYTSGYSNTPSTSIQKQAYEVTKLGFFKDRLLVTGGVSRTWVDNNNYKTTANELDPANPAAIRLPIGPYTDSLLDSQQDTYMGGGIIKPTESSSLYYTFSTNAGPTTYNNLPIWQTGRQQEFGFKTEFFNGRLSINGDHFQITELNLSTPNPLFNLDTTQPQNILGDATSKGYELNVVGGITKNLSVIASITSMKYRDQFGRRVRNVPDHLANLLLNYRFSEGALKGLNGFAGIVHVGDVAGETVTGATTAANVRAGTAPAAGIIEQPGFYVAGWTVLNAGAGYGWGRYHVNLNVDNALNSKFWWQPASRVSVSPYPGLTARVTFTAHL
jgi:iron complex outermembrane receptor protein